MAQIIAEGQSDPSTLQAFRERFHFGRRAVVKELLSAWKATGEIHEDTNVEILMDIIYGTVYMRLLVGHAPLDDEFARTHIDYIYHLLDSSIARKNIP